MSSGGAAGRRPGQKRPTPTRATRTRVAEPTRRPKRKEVEQVGRQTTLTARAAILVLAVASVMLAVALPLKIWLGQRSDLADLNSQIARANQRIAQLNAQDKRWNSAGYIEQQARQRLHFMMPGEKSYVVLGKGRDLNAAAAAKQKAAATSNTWYGQFWQTEQQAGASSSRPVTDKPETSATDLAAVGAQLHRPPRATRQVAHRCSCGLPDVVETSPRLEDGTPFPTLYYLTCPSARSAIGRLEASGLMREMTARLATDASLAARYQAAHEDYLSRRDAIEPLGTEVTAGGMPTRVKCLHVLVAHSLAVGPGVNPFGDEALAMLDDWGSSGPCVTAAEGPA